MSLILDALKQADSERARGAVPGVFSQALQETTAPAPAPDRRSPLIWLLAATAGVALLGFLTWPHTPWGARLPATPQTAQQATAASPPSRPTPAAAPPTAAALFKPAPALAAVTHAPAPSEPIASTAQPPVARVDTHTAPSPVTQTARPYFPEPSPAPPPTAAELPPETRAQLPSIQISGHTYSHNAALRTMTIDGRMLVEGQAVTPGLRVERIGPHQAVFNHRGTRFSVDY